MKKMIVVIFATLISQMVFADVEALLECKSHKVPLLSISTQFGVINGIQEKFSVKHLFFSVDGSKEKVVIVDDPTLSKFNSYLDNNSFTSKFLTIMSELSHDGEVEFNIYYGSIQPKDSLKSAVFNWSNYSIRASKDQSAQFNLSFQEGNSFNDVLTFDCYQSTKFK